MTRFRLTIMKLWILFGIFSVLIGMIHVNQIRLRDKTIPFVIGNPSTVPGNDDGNKGNTSSPSEIVCDASERDTMIHSDLPLDSDGVVNLTSWKKVECLSMNPRNSGVYQYMDKVNFENVDCSKLDKRFLDEGEMETTLLVSSPGAGNTWTRHLIEELTGIHTGSVYNDKGLKEVFLGESYTENVIVVKTHARLRKTNTYTFPWSKVILIVRDPFETFLSHYNYMHTEGHTGLISKEDFNMTDFIEFLKIRLVNYKPFHLQWLNDYTGKLYMQLYEDLKTDLLNSLLRIASFLGTNVNLKTLWCAYIKQTGNFKRGTKPGWVSREHLIDAELENNLTDAKGKVLEAWKNRTF